jgi:transcriptional regulator with XRE-family HTH domain
MPLARQSTLQKPPTVVNREREAGLKAWLARRGIGHRQLARQLGVHPSMITRIFKGERRPPKRIRQLIDLGIPADLLPAPNVRGPGRPRLQKA